MIKATILAALATAILGFAGVAGAAAPLRDTSEASFSFVDDETCAFPIDVTLERSRSTTTFANGDVQRHVKLIVTSSANGKVWVDRDAFAIFIPAATPDQWTIVGEFTHTRVTGDGTILMQSGRLAYNAATDTVTDLHPGPHGTGADPDAYAVELCSALAP